MDIVLFGQLAEITGSDTISLPAARDTDGLVAQLVELFPALAGAKYLIAVDKKITRSNTLIGEASGIALLPPFSGG